MTVAPADPGRADTGNPGASALQREIDRLLGSTPIHFDVGEVELSERHRRILNNVVPALLANSGQSVTVVGYTDDSGLPETNLLLSQARAQNVIDYLVEQGVPAAQLSLDGTGENQASGSVGLAPLDRRVDFRVSGTIDGEQTAAPVDGVRVAIVGQSAPNDLAFTQSMVDAFEAVGVDNDLSVTIEENIIPADARNVLSDLASQGFDLVIAHSYQYGPAVAEVAQLYPGVVFAWGTGGDTFGLPNVYAYSAQAEQGGYVLGTMAALLSDSGRLGFIGPLEIGDAARYATGFEAGARAQRPGTLVSVDYTGSFSEVALAAEAAQAQIDSGVDALTGSSQAVVGAVDVAANVDALWFGNQANQSALAPNLVVASQVYNWEVLLNDIVGEVSSGQPAGRAMVLNLGNGGLAIEFNASYPLPPDVRSRADEVLQAVEQGAIVPPS